MKMTQSNSTITIPQHISLFADMLDDGLMAMARYWDNLPGYSSAVQSKMNYVALVQAQTPLNELRSVLGNKFEAEFGMLPLVLDDDVYSFAAQIEPVMVSRLQRGEWWGDYPALQKLDISLAVQVSALSVRLLDASLLLLPDNLSDSERASAEAELQDLILLFDVDQALPIPLQLAACYATLEAMAEDDPDFLPYDDKGLDTEDIGCFAGLQAVYTEIDSAIFVIDSGDALASVDWACVQEKFGADFGRIQFTTSTLLATLAQYDMAVTFAIGRYHLTHGRDVLADLQVRKEQLIINAAQTVLHLYSTELPHGYIKAHNEASLSVHIHNLQNQFLKVQFQYELLTMLCDIPNLPAPRLHIDRSLTSEERVDCLHQHLREWLSLYERLLDSVRVSEMVM